MHPDRFREERHRFQFQFDLEGRLSSKLYLSDCFVDFKSFLYGEGCFLEIN